MIFFVNLNGNRGVHLVSAFYKSPKLRKWHLDLKSIGVPVLTRTYFHQEAKNFIGTVSMNKNLFTVFGNF
jgi:hypothetical protein